MEFETLFKVIVAMAAAFGIPLAVYAGVAAIRATWGKAEPNSNAAPLQERVAELETRVADLESGHDRVRELEERLDFAERLLARQHEPGRLQD